MIPSKIDSRRPADLIPTEEWKPKREPTVSQYIGTQFNYL